ncbi:preprotein translocase subunit SecY [Candidatus Dependentiae bacterium]|nr:preprotein translocase subunit SecY [Candidatus Dependentiae bacterium]MCC7415096.1 preprotein translocase subunit SecY [Campylobacterota bacterium]
MILLRNFVNIFFIPELRKKLFFTLVVLVVFRLGNHIPVVGVDVDALQQMIAKWRTLGGLFSYLDMFSGGQLSQATLFALGVAPYITASIMMQMLGLSVPYLEQLLKEGEYGRRIVNQYTRYLALIVGVVQSSTYAILLERNNLVVEPGWGFRLLFIFSLTVGAMFVMWLGEQISLLGIGNGSSIIIFAGIVAQFPKHLLQTINYVREDSLSVIAALFILAVFLGIIGCIVFLERGQRKIPVQYARRVVGQRMYAAQSTYIPFKINTAGVMPVILAGSVLQIPMWILTVLAQRYDSFKHIAEWFSPTGLLLNVLQFAAIILFTFVYTALVFNPDELADNIKKNGGFIPGIRPGKKTAEFFNYILTRIGLVGAVYLALLAVIPTILFHAIKNMPFYLGGTGMLIVVGVALEMAAQVESYLIEHRYEGFLSTGKFRGRN